MLISEFLNFSRSGQHPGAVVLPGAAGRQHQHSQSAGLWLGDAGVPLLPRVRPPAAEGRPPQTPAPGAQAGHRRRQADRRPARVRRPYPSAERRRCFKSLLCSLRYTSYWRRRFREQPVTEFCSVIRTNSTGPAGASAEPLLGRQDEAAQALVLFVSTEKQEDYLLLCDVLPEDRALRERLQQNRLVRQRPGEPGQIRAAGCKHACSSFSGGGAGAAAAGARGPQLPPRLHVLQPGVQRKQVPKERRELGAIPLKPHLNSII